MLLVRKMRTCMWLLIIVVVLLYIIVHVVSVGRTLPNDKIIGYAITHSTYYKLILRPEIGYKVIGLEHILFILDLPRSTLKCSRNMFIYKSKQSHRQVV